MRCKFAGYNIEGLDDCIEIVEGTLKVCSIYVHDNIINKNVKNSKAYKNDAELEDLARNQRYR